MIDLKLVARWVGGILVIILALALYNGHQRSLGALEAKIASLEVQTKVLSHEADSLEGVFRVDTVTLTRLSVRSETTLTHLIDTALIEHHDTVRVPVEVLIQSDSVIKACRIVQSDCAKLADTQKGEIADLRAELSATKAKTPSWLSERFGVGAGYSCVVSGSPKCGPAVGAIVRVWP